MMDKKLYQGSRGDDEVERLVQTAQSLAMLSSKVESVIDLINKLDSRLVAMDLKNDDDNRAIWKAIADLGKEITSLKEAQAKSSVWNWVLGLVAGAVITTLVALILTKALQ